MDRPRGRAVSRHIGGRGPAQHEAGQKRKSPVAQDSGRSGAPAVVGGRRRCQHRGIRVAGGGAQLRESRSGTAAAGLRPDFRRPDQPVSAQPVEHPAPGRPPRGSGRVHRSRCHRARSGRIPRHRAAVGRQHARQLQHLATAGDRDRRAGGRLPGRGGTVRQRAAARAGAGLRRLLRSRCLRHQARHVRFRPRPWRAVQQLADLHSSRGRPGRLPAQPGRLPAGHVPGPGPGDHHRGRPGPVCRPRNRVAGRAGAQQPRGDRGRGRVARGDDHRDSHHFPAFSPGHRTRRGDADRPATGPPSKPLTAGAAVR